MKKLLLIGAFLLSAPYAQANMITNGSWQVDTMSVDNGFNGMCTLTYTKDANYMLMFNFGLSKEQNISLSLNQDSYVSGHGNVATFTYGKTTNEIFFEAEKEDKTNSYDLNAHDNTYNLMNFIRNIAKENSLSVKGKFLSVKGWVFKGNEYKFDMEGFKESEEELEKCVNNLM